MKLFHKDFGVYRYRVAEFVNRYGIKKEQIQQIIVMYENSVTLYYWAEEEYDKKDWSKSGLEGLF